MGAIVTVKTEYGEMDYEFDVAADGVEFKKDLMKGYKGVKKKPTITIKKTKDIPPKPDKKRYYEY